MGVIGYFIAGQFVTITYYPFFGSTWLLYRHYLISTKSQAGPTQFPNKTARAHMSTQAPLLWISWENHTRNRSLSAHLNAHLVQLDYPHARRVQRYALSLGKTLCLLWQWRNQVVIAQNPSIILSLLCVVLRPVLRYRLVIDAHNAGFSPKKAIVSGYKNCRPNHSKYGVHHSYQYGYGKIIEAKQGRPLVLPDPLPTLHAPAQKNPWLIRSFYLLLGGG